MKYVIIGDNHWGTKSFCLQHFELMLNYYKKEIIPHMKKMNIDTIIHMGDLFDNRVKMDINFFNNFIDKFVGLLKEENIKFITIIGNHDIYFKNRNDISIVKYLPIFYDGIKVINEPTEIISDGKNMLLIPWLDDIKYTEYGKHNYIFGHFEMNGIFENLKGEISPSSFQGENIIKVFSGHYHNKSTKGKIQYVGTPYQLDWGDCGDLKGIWTLDTETDKIDFHINTYNSLFIKIKYKENDDYKYSLEGHQANDEKFENVETLIETLKTFNNPKIKIFINEASSQDYINDIYKIKQADFKYDLFDNVELKNITGVDVVKEMSIQKEENLIENKVNYNVESDTLQFIYDNIHDSEITQLLKKIEIMEL